jgi:hypothetical protein
VPDAESERTESAAHTSMELRRELAQLPCAHLASGLLPRIAATARAGAPSALSHGCVMPTRKLELRALLRVGGDTRNPRMD